MKIGTAVRIKNTMLYNGRIGQLRPNSGDPEDIWDYNVLLDRTEEHRSTVIGVTVDQIEEIN